MLNRAIARFVKQIALDVHDEARIRQLEAAGEPPRRDNHRAVLRRAALTREREPCLHVVLR